MATASNLLSNQIMDRLSMIQLGTFIVVKLSSKSTVSVITENSEEKSEEESIPWYHGIDVIDVEQSTSHKLNVFDQSVMSNTQRNSHRSFCESTGRQSCSASLSELDNNNNSKPQRISFANDTHFQDRDEGRRKAFLTTRKSKYHSVWHRAYWRQRWRRWLQTTEKRVIRIIAA